MSNLEKASRGLATGLVWTVLLICVFGADWYQALPWLWRYGLVLLSTTLFLSWFTHRTSTRRESSKDKTL